MRSRSFATTLIAAVLLVTGCGSDRPAPVAAPPPPPAAPPAPVVVEVVPVCDQPVSRSTLQRGSSGDDVRELQEALKLVPDGVFGPNTERAVRDFQRANDLRADGVVGDRTWQALGLICVDGAPQSAAPAATPPASQPAPAPPAAPSPQPSSRSTDVIVTIDTARRSGSTISVSGTATVPDGAFVAYEVVPARGGMSMKEGAARVQSGRFSFDTNVSGFPSGPVEVWVAFVTILGGPTYDAKQPNAVIDLYGGMGQNITGPDVTPGMLRLVEAVTIVN
jgi:peptidoglycan hydrolase-like protein with peptidoglycan-binding domain